MQTKKTLEKEDYSHRKLISLSHIFIDSQLYFDFLNSCVIQGMQSNLILEYYIRDYQSKTAKTLSSYKEQKITKI